MMTANKFVLHEHFSQHHHFDFRLERDDVLKSWAVPKGLPERTRQAPARDRGRGPSPLYGNFKGTIPEGEYGAGEVRIADAGRYETLVWGDERIEVVLHGRQFSGKYVLLRFKKAGEKNWLVLKGKET